jgi:hypothetical protein
LWTNSRLVCRSQATNLQPHPVYFSRHRVCAACHRDDKHRLSHHRPCICTPLSPILPTDKQALPNPMREPLPSPPPSPPPPPEHLQQQCSAPPNRGPDEDELPSSSPASMLDASASASAEEVEAGAVAHADLSDAPSRHHHMLGDVDAPAPAFWSTRHARSASYHSIIHTGSGPIQLEDHSEEQHEQSQACWARSVTVDDYTVVSGTSGIGAYVVWHCTVSTLEGGDMSIRKR